MANFKLEKVCCFNLLKRNKARSLFLKRLFILHSKFFTVARTRKKKCAARKFRDYAFVCQIYVVSEKKTVYQRRGDMSSFDCRKMKKVSFLTIIKMTLFMDNVLLYLIEAVNPLQHVLWHTLFWLRNQMKNFLPLPFFLFFLFLIKKLQNMWISLIFPKRQYSVRITYDITARFIRMVYLNISTLSAIKEEQQQQVRNNNAEPTLAANQAPDISRRKDKRAIDKVYEQLKYLEGHGKDYNTTTTQKNYQISEEIIARVEINNLTLFLLDVVEKEEGSWWRKMSSPMKGSRHVLSTTRFYCCSSGLLSHASSSRKDTQHNKHIHHKASQAPYNSGVQIICCQHQQLCCQQNQVDYRIQALHDPGGGWCLRLHLISFREDLIAAVMTFSAMTASSQFQHWKLL